MRQSDHITLTIRKIQFVFNPINQHMRHTFFSILTLFFKALFTLSMLLRQPKIGAIILFSTQKGGSEKP